MGIVMRECHDREEADQVCRAMDLQGIRIVSVVADDRDPKTHDRTRGWTIFGQAEFINSDRIEEDLQRIYEEDNVTQEEE